MIGIRSGVVGLVSHSLSLLVVAGGLVPACCLWFLPPIGDGSAVDLLSSKVPGGFRNPVALTPLRGRAQTATGRAYPPSRSRLPPLRSRIGL